jgi:hypothetical protein
VPKIITPQRRKERREIQAKRRRQKAGDRLKIQISNIQFDPSPYPSPHGERE